MKGTPLHQDAQSAGRMHNHWKTDREYTVLQLSLHLIGAPHPRVRSVLALSQLNILCGRSDACIHLKRSICHAIILVYAYYLESDCTGVI